jgi:integrase/recombinase XerD
MHTVIRSAVKVAAINKPITSHTLRHSLVTHKLERGQDIRLIQWLLSNIDIIT